MSRKHFIALAAAIRSNILDIDQRRAVAHALLPMLQSINPNFDSDRFTSACVGGSL